MDKELFGGGEPEKTGNIFDLELESWGRKSAQTGILTRKDREFSEIKSNSLVKFWQFGQK